MTPKLATLCATITLVLLVAGCESRDPNWKETVPVTGIITVAGVPTENVGVKFHPAGGMDQKQPTITQARTNAEGKFAATTYELADGAPPGEYTLTFELQQFDPISMSFGGDKLKGKHSNPEKSTHKITVTSGTPLDMGTIDL